MTNLTRKAGLLKLAIYGTTTEGPDEPGQVGLEELAAELANGLEALEKAVAS